MGAGTVLPAEETAISKIETSPCCGTLPKVISLKFYEGKWGGKREIPMGGGGGRCWGVSEK